MLRLNLTNEPAWVEMIPGLRLLLAPLDTAMMLAARADAAAEGLGSAGAAEADVVMRVVQLLARRAILEWEGVGDEHGNPLPVTPGAVDALVRNYPVFEAFQAKFVVRAMALDAEKNGFAPSRNGTLAGAPDIAADATGSVPSARPASTDP